MYFGVQVSLHSCINLTYVIKLIFNPSLWNIDNIAPLVVNVYLGLWPREIFLRWVYYLASERSERNTLCRSLMENKIRIYIYIYIYIRHTLVARSWGYVMWEELSVSQF